MVMHYSRKSSNAYIAESALSGQSYRVTCTLIRVAYTYNSISAYQLYPTFAVSVPPGGKVGKRDGRQMDLADSLELIAAESEMERRREAVV